VKESVANKHRFPKRRQPRQSHKGQAGRQGGGKSETTTSCSIRTTSHMTQPTNPTNRPTDRPTTMMAMETLAFGYDNGYI